MVPGDDADMLKKVVKLLGAGKNAALSMTYWPNEVLCVSNTIEEISPFSLKFSPWISTSPVARVNVAAAAGGVVVSHATPEMTALMLAVPGGGTTDV
jgi:hypothetical protein